MVYKLKHEIIIYKYSLGHSFICLEGQLIKTSWLWWANQNNVIFYLTFGYSVPGPQKLRHMLKYLMHKIMAQEIRRFASMQRRHMTCIPLVPSLTLCRTEVTMHTTHFNVNNKTVQPHSFYVGFIWFSEQTVIVSFNIINCSL